MRSSARKTTAASSPMKGSNSSSMSACETCTKVFLIGKKLRSVAPAAGNYRFPATSAHAITSHVHTGASATSANTYRYRTVPAEREWPNSGTCHPQWSGLGGCEPQLPASTPRDASVRIHQNQLTAHFAMSERGPRTYEALALWGRSGALVEPKHVSDEQGHEGKRHRKVVQSSVNHGGGMTWRELTPLSLKEDAWYGRQSCRISYAILPRGPHNPRSEKTKGLPDGGIVRKPSHRAWR